MKTVLFEDSRYKVMEMMGGLGNRAKGGSSKLVIVDKMNGTQVSPASLPFEVLSQCPFTVFEKAMPLPQLENMYHG